MDTNKFFSLLKTQQIPVNLLRKGDIIRIGNSVVVLDDVEVHSSGFNEYVTLKQGICSWYVQAYATPDCKWTNYTAVVRDSLTMYK